MASSAVKRICSQSILRNSRRSISIPLSSRSQWQPQPKSSAPFLSLSSNAHIRTYATDRKVDAPSRKTDYFTDEGQAELQKAAELAGFVPEEVQEDLDEGGEEEPVDKSQLGFWAEGEEELGPDEEFYGDDISALGHKQLELHREQRQYARIAAWELPLLAKLAKPFELPSKEQVIRFRYTTYLGEDHPAAHKVVAQFAPEDIPALSPQQQAKLIKLCGTRYNPETGLVRMSCESFDSQIQNKRFLSDVVNSLINEAKDGKDTFDDVPFDFRHHKPKPKYEFPEAWLLTPERKKELEMRRNQRLDEDNKRLQSGGLIDGTAIIEEYLGSEAARIPEPEMVTARGQRGQKRLR